MKIEFLLPSQSTSTTPDGNGVYRLSQGFEAPNSMPKMLRFADAGFSPTAYSLQDGAGCIATLIIDENGHTKDAQIIRCDDSCLENPALRSLWKSQFSPAVLNGKTVAVRASIHIVCIGFETR